MMRGSLRGPQQGRLRRTVRLLAAAALLAPAPLSAFPPPPPPISTTRGPAPVCAAGFGLRLMSGERAEKYAGGSWVIVAPGLDLSVSTDQSALEGETVHAVIPGLGAGERQRIREWPGNRYHGWVYAFPIGDGGTLRIASFQFQGSDADRALLGRVLIGRARDALCAPRM